MPEMDTIGHPSLMRDILVILEGKGLIKLNINYSRHIIENKREKTFLSVCSLSPLIPLKESRLWLAPNLDSSHPWRSSSSCGSLLEANLGLVHFCLLHIFSIRGVIHQR